MQAAPPVKPPPVGTVFDAAAALRDAFGPLTGIVNDANAWGEEHGDPRYILELIQRLVTVSLRTVEIVESLPPLDIPPSRE